MRIVACLLLAIVPLAYCGSRFWSGRLGEMAANDLTRPAEAVDELQQMGLESRLTRQVSRAVFEPAVVLMSIEPEQSRLRPETESPVIFPGYLLPEDANEDTAHEGS